MPPHPRKKYAKIVERMYEMMDGLGTSNPRMVSRIMYVSLINFLDLVTIEDNRFSTAIANKMRKMLGINKRMKSILKRELSGVTISDLNSVVIGVPAMKETDLDFVIPVNSKTHQNTIAQQLADMGFELSASVTEKAAKTPIKWKTYKTTVSGGTEIEIKLRSSKIFNIVMVAHSNMKKYLSKSQKRKVSYIKTLMAGTKQYKQFKMILYTAMFMGDKVSFVMK